MNHNERVAPGKGVVEHRQEKKHKYGFKVVIGLVISLLCLSWLLRFIDIDKLLVVLKSAKLEYLAFAMIATSCSYALRAARWPFFFLRTPPTFFASFSCLIVGFFMNNVLPARIGELVRAHIGGRAVKQSRALVLATIAGERLVDGLTISLFFALMFTFSSSAVDLAIMHDAYVCAGLLSSVASNITVPFAPIILIPLQAVTDATAKAGDVRYGESMYLVAYLFLVAGIGTITMLLLRQRVFGLIERFGAIMPGHVSSYSIRRIRLFVQGLEPMLCIRKIIPIVLFSIVVWSVELFVFYFITQAFHQHIGLGGLSLFLAVVNFSSLIPAAPGGIGVIELLATMALTGIGVDAEAAFAMVLVQHVIQIVIVGIPGAYFFFYLLGGQVPNAENCPDVVDGDEVKNGQNSCEFTSAETSQANNHIALLGQVFEKSFPVDISIVIPAFNEEDRLPKTLLLVTEYIKTRTESFEVLVVNDGSADGTADVVKKFSKLASQVKLLNCPGNRGKGYAVRLGMMKAQGRLVLFNDADGATPIQEIERLESAIRKGAHIAIGSRAKFSQDTEVTTRWYRKYIGRVFNGAVNVLLLPGIADTQCGFKMFLNPVAKCLFAQQKIEGFSFDVEILCLARKMGCLVAEVPVNWTNIAGSKVNLVKDSIRMLLDILQFRLRSIVKGYSTKKEMQQCIVDNVQNDN